MAGRENNVRRASCRARGSWAWRCVRSKKSSTGPFAAAPALMLSVKRFDPNAAAESSPAVKAPDNGLAALRARLDQRKLKRKREQEDEGVQEPAINKTVTFSNIVQAQEAPATAPTPTEPKEPASKTKAKARYLKNKKQRYKAHQKALPKEQRAGGPAPKTKDDEDNVDDAADPLRAARREERKAKRRAERDALAAEEGDMRTSSPVLEPLPVTEKPKKRKKRDREDADPLALSTANRDEDEPALPVGLERFPKPRKLVAPDRALLQELGVADELRDGVQIEPSLTVDVRLPFSLAMTLRADDRTAIGTAFSHRQRASRQLQHAAEAR